MESPSAARRTRPQPRRAAARAIASASDPHHGRLIDRHDGFDVVDCAGCGFVHVNPLPDPALLAAEYRHDYYSREKPLYLEGRRRDLDWWHRVHAERYELFEQLLPPERRQLLEIGSGPGDFLQVGRERGWQTLGVEPSAQASAHSRSLGLDVVEDLFSAELAPTLGRHDAVQMTNVLEHLPDPRATLELVRGLLEPGGLLGVVVPNDYSPFQKALRSVRGFRPWWLAPPHHLNYFSFESLAALLAETGFEVESHTASFPIDLFLMMGEDYIADSSLGRRCHERRMQLEKTLHEAGLDQLKTDLYQAFAGLGIGREIVLVARRG